jgi:GTPase SAR1 family protein
MESDENGTKSQTLPQEEVIAIAFRVGLRVLPWLALPKESGVLVPPPEKDVERNLLAIFLAYDLGLLGICDQISNELGLEAQIRLDATNHAISANTATADGAVTIAIALAIAIVANSAGTKADITYAITANATATATANTYGFITAFNINIFNDLKILRKSGEKVLTESPLWVTKAPAAWQQQMKQFQKTLHALESGFDFWLEWYAALCIGNTVDLNLLKQRVFLPKSISSQSPKEINDYLASLTHRLSTAPLNRVRTIFIGDGEVGKTSLIRVLQGEPVIEGIEPKTPGIEISEWHIPETDITASFWDFGGQVMAHATHQLFLRESCLYVLLVSAREKEKATERAEYWLEHVKSFGKGAPVLIVANKADKEPVRLNESLLIEKYPNMICGFFQVSCTNVKGKFHSQFEQFHHAFCKQLQAVGLHQVQFMKPHFAVLQTLRERTPGQAFLTHADYNTLCDEQKVDEYGALDRNWLLDILDKLGVIVHFPDMIEMDEYILNPRWLTYGVYTLMYNEQARLTRAQAVALLAAKPVADQYGNQLSYPASKCRIVFEAMRKYKLCYFLHSHQHLDQDQIIIPALLPSDIKQHGFDSTSALEFHYQFESFLPRHLISELIVECHTDIARRDGQEMVWQHGVLLNNATHQTRALIQADYHFRRLSIWLSRGPRMADMLAALRTRIGNIVARIDIEYVQNVRLPSEALQTPPRLDAKPIFADYLQLREMADDGEDTYYKSGGKYSIGKILGLFEPQGGASGGSGNTYVNISGSTIHGSVTTAGEITDSLNNAPQAKA